ncbi:hypothetical protein PPYR_03184 [Photinus pyralis]|uniref:Uncharacterized protein n=2 Tax=Photinus pyralis TaxID=7054 RepID=A0A5N4A222_PHOPY|nr:hypothetical protein PPYR_03184 [Photinus pyralis]
MNYVYQAVRPLREFLRNLLSWTVKLDRTRTSPSQFFHEFCDVYKISRQPVVAKGGIQWKHPGSLIGPPMERKRPFCFRTIVAEQSDSHVYKVQEHFMCLGSSLGEKSKKLKGDGPIIYRELPNSSDLLADLYQLRQVVLARTSIVHDNGDKGTQGNRKCNVYLFVNQQ